MSQTSKKLVLVSTISVPVTDTSGKKVARMLCIYYLVRFWERQEQVKALFNVGSKVNVMSPAFVRKLGLHI